MTLASPVWVLSTVAPSLAVPIRIFCGVDLTVVTGERRQYLDVAGTPTLVTVLVVVEVFELTTLFTIDDTSANRIYTVFMTSVKEYIGFLNITILACATSYIVTFSKTSHDTLALSLPHDPNICPAF